MARTLGAAQTLGWTAGTWPLDADQPPYIKPGYHAIGYRVSGLESWVLGAAEAERASGPFRGTLGRGMC